MKMGKGARFVLIVLGIIMLLSWIMTLFPKAAEKVASVVNVPVDTFKLWVTTIAVVATGVFLVWAGIASLAIPVLGIALILAGVAMVVYALWPVFRSNSNNPMRG